MDEVGPPCFLRQIDFRVLCKYCNVFQMSEGSGPAFGPNRPAPEGDVR